MPKPIPLSDGLAVRAANTQGRESFLYLNLQWDAAASTPLSATLGTSIAEPHPAHEAAP